MNVQRPQDLHGIRSFLGLTSYFRRHIPGYALISAPLEQLKTKDTPFVWTDDCESAFKQLKRALVKPPILVYPDHRKRFLLFVDSSRYAVGACLMQKVKGRNRVVVYASKLLTGSQKTGLRRKTVFRRSSAGAWFGLHVSSGATWTRKSSTCLRTTKLLRGYSIRATAPVTRSWLAGLWNCQIFSLKCTIGQGLQWGTSTDCLDYLPTELMR